MGEVQGNIAKDIISFPNGMKTEQVFLNVIYSKELTGIKADGVCGMAFNSLSDMYPTFIENLYQTGQIDKKQFTFYLTLNDRNDPRSELVIGGFDEAYTDEDFTFAPVIPRNGIYEFWLINIDKILISQTPL